MLQLQQSTKAQTRVVSTGGDARSLGGMLVRREEERSGAHARRW